MDIFKLIFQHDLLLEQLSGSADARNKAKPEMSLEDFMKPIPTYTKYYFSGTRLRENIFGLTTLDNKDKIYTAIQQALGEQKLWSAASDDPVTLAEAMETEPGSVIIASADKPDVDFKALATDDHSGIRDRVPDMMKQLDAGNKVFYLEKAHDGKDLHLFSRDSMYLPLFNALKPLAGPDFRYFSINGKRMSGERSFYFETWTLERPPHGFEEVTADSVI